VEVRNQQHHRQGYLKPALGLQGRFLRVLEVASLKKAPRGPCISSEGKLVLPNDAVGDPEKWIEYAAPWGCRQKVRLAGLG